jgi:hypothetical protein
MEKCFRIFICIHIFITKFQYLVHDNFSYHSTLMCCTMYNVHCVPKSCTTAIPEHAYCGHKFYSVLKMYKIETIYLNKTNLFGGREKACNVSRWIMHHNKDINEAERYPPFSGLCEVRLDSRPLHKFLQVLNYKWEDEMVSKWNKS